MTFMMAAPASSSAPAALADRPLPHDRITYDPSPLVGLRLPRLELRLHENDQVSGDRGESHEVAGNQANRDEGEIGHHQWGRTTDLAHVDRSNVGLLQDLHARVGP